MRVSIDDAGAGKASSQATKSATKPAKSGGGKGAGLDQKQKVKAIVAGSVIVLAGVFIAWQQGLFSGGPGAGTAVEPTPEVLEQLAKQQQQEQNQNIGTKRAAPILGAQ